MKKYHVYGIGNALVDMEYEVQESVLNEHSIEKGVMTLIDADRHHSLTDALEQYDHMKACGGSAANTMITLSQFGGSGFYSCKVASDKLGNFYYQDLRAEGLDTNLERQGREDGVTGKCMVFVTPDADRTMNTYLGITENLSPDEIDVGALSQAEWLYIEGYLVTSPSCLAAAIRCRELAKQHNVKTSLTLSDPNMIKFFKANLLSIIDSKVDLIFSNKDEALLFCDTSDINEACERMQKFTKAFTITLGGDGAMVFDGEQLHHVKTTKVDVIDTLGAGDTFAGAFLYAITHGMSFVTAAEIACQAASRVVTKYGPRLNHNQVQEIKNTIVDTAAA